MSHSDFKHIYQRLLPAIINFLRLSDKNLVTVNNDIPLWPSGEPVDIKLVSVLTKIPHIIGPLLQTE